MIADPPLVQLALPDLWRYCAAQNWPLAAASYSCVLDDLRHGRVFGVPDAAGHIAAIGAITPVTGDLLIAWCSVLPSGLGRPPPVRAIRGLIATVATLGRVVALVAEADPRAQRLVRALGFERIEDARLGHGVWQWRTR